MNNEGFENLEIWKQGLNLSIQTYQSLSDCKDYGLKDQIQRAVVSIPSNIAEGYERNSTKERIYFYNVAKGSCGEYRTQLQIAHAMHYISDKNFQEMSVVAKNISSMLFRFIQYQHSQLKK